jgi:predicted kinase
MATPRSSAELDAAFRRYEVEVRAHGISWWTKDSRVETVLADNPQLLDPLADRAMRGVPIETKDVHYEEHSQSWRAARGELHDSLLGELFGGPSPAVAAPMAVFLLGLPGSGKSTVLRPIAEGLLAQRGGGRTLTRDADEIRVRLPEYVGGRGSEILQDEVVDMTYREATSALPSDCHLVIDLIGDPEWLPTEVRYFAERGRAIAVLCSEVQTEIAERRAKERAVDGGRYVSIDYLRSCAGRPRKALESARGTGEVDLWAVIDTEGSEPRVVEGSESFGTPGSIPRYWR